MGMCSNCDNVPIHERGMSAYHYEKSLRSVTAALQVTIKWARSNISLLEREKRLGERKVAKLAGRWENEIKSDHIKVYFVDVD
jgi:hypothetical protein